MPDLQLLNNITHKDLRVTPHYGAQYGDNIGSVQVFPSEFEALHKEYPVLLRRHSEKGLQAVALLGISSGENLYLSEHYANPPSAGSWMARYVPGILAKGPFLIGYQEQNGIRNAVVHVDMSHPKIVQDTALSGQQIFLPQGGESDYLQNIANILNQLHQGQDEATSFYNALDELNLLTPVNLSITLKSGDKVSVQGHETICTETFASLPGEVMAQLHKKGWLAYIFYLQNALSNVAWLIDMKNALEYTRR
ncbi:SapC family protein [Alteromonas sp. D210916BOD_24]|uniref:SapC family protein n=1 Tax=Alteromonas sp. D210916BOD_24 TaxID=3157618 RepID=UPI00399D5188